MGFRQTTSDKPVGGDNMFKDFDVSKIANTKLFDMGTQMSAGWIRGCRA